MAPVESNCRSAIMKYEPGLGITVLPLELFVEVESDLQPAKAIIPARKSEKKEMVRIFMIKNDFDDIQRYNNFKRLPPIQSS
jgi:hypothetical protein